MKIKNIKEELFRFNIALVYGTKEEVRKYSALFQSEIAKTGGSARPIDVPDKGRYYLLWVNSEEEAQFYALTHELIHVVFMHFDYIGLRYEEMSGEVYAYVYGHLLEKIVKHLKSKDLMDNFKL